VRWVSDQMEELAGVENMFLKMTESVTDDMPTRERVGYELNGEEVRGPTVNPTC